MDSRTQSSLSRSNSRLSVRGPTLYTIRSVKLSVINMFNARFEERKYQNPTRLPLSALATRVMYFQLEEAFLGGRFAGTAADKVRHVLMQPPLNPSRVVELVQNRHVPLDLLDRYLLRHCQDEAPVQYYTECVDEGNPFFTVHNPSRVTYYSIEAPGKSYLVKERVTPKRFATALFEGLDYTFTDYKKARLFMDPEEFDDMMVCLYGIEDATTVLSEEESDEEFEGGAESE